MSIYNSETKHVPVLFRETLDLLNAKEGGIFLDCTFGGGGHTRGILEANPENWVVALDRDPNSLKRAESWRGKYGERLDIHHAAFSQASQCVGNAKFDGILADLGVSTDQLFEGRGFSFADSDLDMRMDPSAGQSVAEFLNTASEREIFLALARGGVNQNGKQIARRIFHEKPITSAQALADLIASSGLGKNSKVHPATVVFQALRIAVNNELSELERLLEIAPALVKPGGVLAIITFHSLEDTLVTRTMRGWEGRDTAPAGWRGVQERNPKLGSLLTKKAVRASEGEVKINAASRSAGLRVFRFAV